jgi:acyl-CoA synthetase (NDP forming)
MCTCDRSGPLTDKEEEMGKLTKDFFTGNEVLFVGYSSRQRGFCNMVAKAFARNGITVYPLNTKSKGPFPLKVYASLKEIPKLPTTAYILTNKENTKQAVQELKAKGIKRILFHSKKSVAPETLEECRSAGIETAVACPLMFLGSFLHRIHGFFAGV